MTATVRKILYSSCILFLILAPPSVAAEDTASQDEVFATVGSSKILVSEYRLALIRASRNTFYHAKPPEKELLAFQKKVADEIINRELLLQQAAQMGLDLDKDALDKELDKHRERASRHGKEIDEQGEAWLTLIQFVREDLLTGKLENLIRQRVDAPSESELRTYYEANQDKFTEPAQYNLSTILLGVDPSSGSEAWEAAREEARELVERLRGGADFAELARIHSSDASASDGGELGYSHKGMFNAQAQVVIEQLQPGEISDPLQVLEGIVIFRLNDKLPAKVHPYAEAREKAGELWLREARDQYWLNYLEDLRKNTNIEIKEKYLTISGEESVNTGPPELN